MRVVKRFEKECETLVKMFCEKQELEFDYWSDNVIGAVAVFKEEIYLDISDIALDLKEDIKKGEILKWVEENFNRDVFNWRSYKSYIHQG